MATHITSNKGISMLSFDNKMSRSFPGFEVVYMCDSTVNVREETEIRGIPTDV